MDECTHLEYTFSDPRAAEFFRNIAGPDKPNTRWRAWYSAHKFGATVTAPGLASFERGIVYGARALEAAKYADSGTSAGKHEIENMFNVAILYERDL